MRQARLTALAPESSGIRTVVVAEAVWAASSRGGLRTESVRRQEAAGRSRVEVKPTTATAETRLSPRVALYDGVDLWTYNPLGSVGLVRRPDPDEIAPAVFELGVTGAGATLPMTAACRRPALLRHDWVAGRPAHVIALRGAFSDRPDYAHYANHYAVFGRDASGYDAVLAGYGELWQHASRLGKPAAVGYWSTNYTSPLSRAAAAELLSVSW
ncbi:MAG: hypothetical protein HY329_00605 [Chloroflexi bacterium]|nr:hypothetical protein [Chloroflexota bacterium]